MILIAQAHANGYEGPYFLGRALAGAAGAGAGGGGRIPGVGVREAQELMDRGHVYLDVRTEEEFVRGHVEGSVCVPVYFAGPGGNMVPNPDFLAGVEAALPEADRDTPFVIGCRSGVRSLDAGALMRDAGYLTLLNVEGGFLDWDAQGLPWVQ